MGKIRIKTLGSPEEEVREKERSKARREAKKLAKGAHGGERLISMAPTEEELEKMTLPAEEEPKLEIKKEAEESKPKPAKKPLSVRQAGHIHSARYMTLKKAVDPSRLYSLGEAVALLKKTSNTKFKEAAEVHINLREKGIRGTVNLPHGAGKEIRVAVADDKLISEVSQGKISFDVLLATPQMMPKLATVAKILGPKGLMPNPKAGTIIDEPAEAVKKFQKGSISFKTEQNAPIIHTIFGRVSQKENELEENLRALIKAIDPKNIQKITICSTMGPGIKVNIAAIA